MTFEIGGAKVGVQICWELVFPGPWAQLKRGGAQVILHLNNAIKAVDAFWEHLLLARAFENRYFVGSANNAASPQWLPSYLIAPSSETLRRCEPRAEQAPPMNSTFPRSSPRGVNAGRACIRAHAGDSATPAPTASWRGPRS